MRGRLIALAWMLTGSACSAATGPELEPYRAMATSARGAHLIAIAQAALIGEPSASTDSNAALSARDSLVPEWPATPRPVYVTLVSGGATRACLGTDSPLGSLEGTVRALATRLLTDDRRRAPIDSDELERLRLVIAFAGVAEPIAEPDRVDPMREGLRIETERGAIAFLPGEARTIAWALREARRVGVLTGATSDARFSRFDVVTLSGPARVPSRD